MLGQNRLARGLQKIEKSTLEVRVHGLATRTPRPFISWAGSKRRLLPQLISHFPTEMGRYYEPFLGGGSVALLVEPGRATLTDACEPLIETWQAVVADPLGLFELVDAMELTKENYYDLRSQTFESPIERAAQFLFLNRGAFNGLYRVNRSGVFNVPWGAPRSGFIALKENLLAVSALLRKKDISIRSGDFMNAISPAREGDFVFLDPPYVTGHNNNGFKEYNEQIFSWSDQIRLARSAEAARRRGAFVVVTNANHDSVKQLYPNFDHFEIERTSTLAASPAKRGMVKELVLLGSSKPGRDGESSQTDSSAVGGTG